MRTNHCFALFMLLLLSCRENTNSKLSVSGDPSPIQGTWKLISGTLIEKGNTTVTDYTKGKEFIKVINGTHFSFLSHSLNKKDTSSEAFSAGGGRYELSDSSYTEHLDYCSDRQWEGNSFPFTISMQGDTLIQKGIEKVDSIGVDRMNTEVYVRLKK